MVSVVAGEAYTHSDVRLSRFFDHLHRYDPSDALHHLLVLLDLLQVVGSLQAHP